MSRLAELESQVEELLTTSNALMVETQTEIYKYRVGFNAMADTSVRLAEMVKLADEREAERVQKIKEVLSVLESGVGKGWLRTNVAAQKLRDLIVDWQVR